MSTARQSAAAGRPVDLMVSLVERAALDGSTCVPAPLVAAALRGVGVDSPGAVAEQACEDGRVVAYLDERLFGHPHWAPLEEQVAEHLVDLVTRSGPDGVRVVETPRGRKPPAADDSAVVVEHAHRLGLAEAAALLERLVSAEGRPRLVLAGDPAMPFAPGPGRVLADVVASGVMPVDTDTAVEGADDGADEGCGDRLAALVASLRAGKLPALDPARREVVVTTADGPELALRRAVQLATSSVPRVFGVSAADILVLAPRSGGAAGADALRAALDAAGAGEVRTATAAEAAVDAVDAVVLVLPAESAGSISRAMLVGAATQAARHLSVVHGAGSALATAVARRPHPPRRTRLAPLLTDALG